jgi:hypothetical protein
LNMPPKMDYDTISNLKSPTSQRWDSFLWDGPTKCEVDMSTVYPNLIAYATKFEAELNCTICNIWLWGNIDTPLPYSATPTTWHLTHVAFYLFCILYFVL